jgi:hypothetical protein
VTNDKKAVLLDSNGHKPGSKISRWRWRPGMKPRFAFTIGMLFSAVGLLFVIIGLLSLIAGIQDSYSAPVKVPGVVTGFPTNFLDSLVHVSIRVEKENSTTTIAPAVTQVTAQSLHVGDHVVVYYSQRLNFPYAVQSGGQRFLLLGTSSAGNPFGSVALVLLGLVIFPYPAFLVLWGWRDLQTHGGDTMTARIVGLHSSKQARSPQPGITSRVFRTFYTVALESFDTSIFQGNVTFSLKEEMYLSLREGAVVQITYSPNLHYVYGLKQVNGGAN